MGASVVESRSARAWIAALDAPTAALCEGAAARSEEDYLEETIVTAQKWKQSANTVGLSITAVREEVLRQRDVTSVAELTRIVPGLTIEGRRGDAWQKSITRTGDELGDVRELQAREAQRLSKTGSFTADMMTGDHAWSDELYRIFEFEPGAQISVQSVRAILHPEDLPSFDAEFGRSAAEGIDFDQVFRIVPASGRLKYLHAAAHFLERVEGRPVFIGAIQDVTESKLAEQALNAARTELAHVSRVMTLSALTASIAHEINQPLAGIITNATTCLRMLAVDPPNVEGARATAQRTLRDGNRVSEVIQRLRALFARKQPGTESVDLNDAAREVLALTSSELQGARVILQIDFDAGLPKVRSDRVQLQQVIRNLIVNAADAMKTVHDRPHHLHVATACEAANQVRLSVRDSGVGIDPKDSEKLFEPFYTTKSHGMGIGLSISRSIIESHGGRLWASANDGPGATFAFAIPSASQTEAR